jgi:flavin reductase (DIM6/NTAB) family NADH-FMN oxidoreductase RutF
MAPMKKKPLALSRVYRVIETGPVVLVTTSRKGRPNVMPMSWHTMIDFDPPILGCVVSDRNYSFQTLRTTRECVINIPTVELASKVVKCGNSSGKTVDKFTAFGLTPRPAARVTAPIVDECYVNLECEVVDTRMVASYGFFILQVVKAWIDSSKKGPRTIHHAGKGSFMVAGETIKLPSRKA